MTPEEIIGRNNMQVFVEHYTICQSGTNGGEYPFRRLDKEIGADIRPHIAETMQELRDNGFYPLSVGSDGRIRWGVVTKNASHVEFDKRFESISRLSLEELQSRARRGYVEVIKGVKVDRAQGHEIGLEEVKG